MSYIYHHTCLGGNDYNWGNIKMLVTLWNCFSAILKLSIEVPDIFVLT